MTTQIQNGDYLETWDGDVLVSSVIHRPIVPTRRDKIIASLAEIDQKSDSPRARREAALGNTAWISSLNNQAIALRAELAAL